MAIPSTTGSEVLRRGGIPTQSSTATAFKFDGTNPSTGTSSYTVPSNHIIIMLTIVLTENAGAAESFKMSRTGVTYIEAQAIGAKETFIINDKFVLIGGQYLQVFVTGGGDVDIYYSYIDQNWS